MTDGHFAYGNGFFRPRLPERAHFPASGALLRPRSARRHPERLHCRLNSCRPARRRAAPHTSPAARRPAQPEPAPCAFAILSISRRDVALGRYTGPSMPTAACSRRLRPHTGTKVERCATRSAGGARCWRRADLYRSSPASTSAGRHRPDRLPAPENFPLRGPCSRTAPEHPFNVSVSGSEHLRALATPASFAPSHVAPSISELLLRNLKASWTAILGVQNVEARRRIRSVRAPATRSCGREIRLRRRRPSACRQRDGPVSSRRRGLGAGGPIYSGLRTAARRPRADADRPSLDPRADLVALFLLIQRAARAGS